MSESQRLVLNLFVLILQKQFVYVFRTSTYARQIGMQGDGLGCSTASYYIPSAFIREYVAMCVKMKKLFIGFELLYVLLVLLSYRGILW